MKRIIVRLISILPALALQLIWYAIIYNFYQEHQQILQLILGIYTIVIVLYIVLKKDEPTYKITWLIALFVFPVFGTWLYIWYGDNKTSEKLLKKINIAKKSIKFRHETDKKIIKELSDNTSSYDEIIEFISKYSKFPINYIEDAKYYPLGDLMYLDILEELKKAKEFIYLEYFIIANGKLWNLITEILKEKVKLGVDVRIMYDDIGSITTYNKKDIKVLKKYGIKCKAFNVFTSIRGELNNRDHRKMMIIDNKVAFSGGINLADEYINEKHKYGHWKDIGFKITGKPVSNYTYMFIEFWNAFSKDKINRKIEQNNNKKNNNNGYILSYYDYPNKKEAISNDLYIELLENAKQYIYFYTPYLILGDDLLKALIRTARRGVDIRIIVPGIPDKKIVYRLAKSYFNELIEAGIKIYTYTPGFIHGKATLSDDLICTIGTVNLDYRSLFLHFENNSIFYKSKILFELKKDYLETLKKCKIVKVKKKNIINYFNDGLLRLIAPML